MALRKIALQGEPCLTKVCRPVTEFNDRLHVLLDDLADTLEDSGGVGLAAPQVGVLRRVCVVLDEEDQLIELVNRRSSVLRVSRPAWRAASVFPGNTARSRGRRSSASALRIATATGLRWRTRV